MIRIFLSVALLLCLQQPVTSLANEHTHSYAQVHYVDKFHEYGLEIQLIKARITDGEFVGRFVNIVHIPARYSIYDFDLEKGHRIIVEVYPSDEEILEGKIVGINRNFYVIRFAAIFLAVLLIIGGIKGLRSVIALVLTGFVIVSILIPMILNGHRPLFAAVVSSIIIIVAGFLLIDGFSRKSAAAISGTAGGMLIAAFFAEIFSALTCITGATDQEIIYYIAERGISVDFAGLFVSGVLIGSIGVTMDVSMSVASFIFELKQRSPRLKYLQLVSSGMSVGKDMMATMVNTLVLAYAGASMPLFLLFVNIGMPLHNILNTEIVSAEIIRSLSGSVALILTIPLTSVIASFMSEYKYRRPQYRKVTHQDNLNLHRPH